MDRLWHAFGERNLSHPRRIFVTMNSIKNMIKRKTIDMAKTNRAALETVGASTEVEAWLLDLGLRAVQVDRCPISTCAACTQADTLRAA